MIETIKRNLYKTFMFESNVSSVKKMLSPDFLSYMRFRSAEKIDEILRKPVKDGDKKG